MKFSKTTRIVLIISAAVIVIVVAILSFLSGEVIGFTDSLQALGVFIAGILAALGLSQRGNVVSVCLFLGILGSSACAAQPWITARTALSGATAAVDAIEPLVPPDAERREEAFEMTRNSLELGEIAVATWEREAGDSPPAGWQQWVADFLEGLGCILEITKSAGVRIPEGVLTTLSAVSTLLPLLGAM